MKSVAKIIESGSTGAPTPELHRKASLGQYMTPHSVASYMASLFPPSEHSVCRLLDPGAGCGALSCAFLERWERNDGLSFDSVTVDAFEIDPNMRARLLPAVSEHALRGPVRLQIVGGDFIMLGVEQCLRRDREYTHAILNPPYKKILSSSHHRLALREVGIETVNLYSAFVALALELMAPGGHLVAIIPRSFCNGPYYKPFRDYVFARAAIHKMHLFGSRNSAFKKDNVLQENVIVHLERSGQQGDVIVSTSRDETFNDQQDNRFPFEQIVFPNDPERFVHVPTVRVSFSPERPGITQHSLSEIGIAVSTGPVVDFRTRDNLRDMPEDGCVPLLYPSHFAGQAVEWPKPGNKKPNAIVNNSSTKKLLYPAGFYCVVKRFSSKEEKRRIVASVVAPKDFPDASFYGFENHLNVFHVSKHGLPESLARGLAAFLNTEEVDKAFRSFNGHTQVNATDLRNMKYPSRARLIALGQAAMRGEILTQDIIAKHLEATEYGSE